MTMNRKGVFDAIVKGDDLTLRTILASGTHDIETRLNGKFTVLHYATWFNKTQCVKTCLEFGASVDSPLDMGVGYGPVTSLFIAAGRDNASEIITMLLDAGADGSICSNDNCDTPFTRAVYTDQHFNAKILLDRVGLKNTCVSNLCSQWADDLITNRENVRNTALLVIGILKQSNLSKGQDRHVLRLIGKHIWSSRFQ